MDAVPVTADLYLRLSDFRADGEGSFPERETALRDRADRLGWSVHRVVIENDLDEETGERRPATAYKRQLVRGADGTPVMEHGRKVYRVLRPGWRSVLEDLGSGAANAVLAEDLDRVARDPRDIEDLIDAVAACGGQARSISGSLTLTDGGRSDELAMARVMTAMAAKSSADTSRRGIAGRQRWAGQSYGGGRRPYGFAVVPDSPEHHRQLAVVPAEEAVIVAAVADLLDKRISLKAVVGDLRDRGVPTVTGARWSTETLRDILLNDTVTGLTDDNGTVVWPPIIPQDRQDRLRDLLTADARTVTGKDGKEYRIARNPAQRGNAPRWLLSLIATCGKCGAPMTCTGGTDRRAYTCTEHNHMRRNAAAADAYISGLAVERLSRPDAADLLRPPPRTGIDGDKLRAEARRLAGKRDDLARLLMADVLTEVGVRKERKRIDARLAEIAAQLAASDQPDGLAEFRGAPAAQVWDALSLPRRRAVVKLLMDVTILPAARKGSGFDPDSIRVDWKTG
jgi:DNA invertase Pin-like site-specific DNA recombinase